MTGGPPGDALVDDRCVVWTAEVPSATEHLIGILDEVEATRRAGFREAADRDRFTSAAALLRLLAARLVGVAPSAVRVGRTCPRCGRPHGRPSVGGGSAGALDVSVSHAGRFVAVAAARRGRVGVDVEDVRGDYADLAATVCTDAELTRIRDARDFAVTWVRKESVLKATGAGLDTAPRDVEVSGPADPPVVVRVSGAPADAWQLFDVPIDVDHVAAVALLEAPPVWIDAVDATGLLATPAANRMPGDPGQTLKRNSVTSPSWNT